jgi:two-component system, NarL family, response regulator NreC
MKLKVLMIDDHPSLIEGYKIILSYNNFGYKITTTEAYDSKSAYKIITEKAKEKFDFIFIDYSLPVYRERGIYSGEDLAYLAQRHCPEAKIAMLTSHTEAFLLYNIVKRINPNGLLVKSDFSADELLEAFDAILKGQTYHSQTVIQNLNELVAKPILLDEVNRNIISSLGQGIKTKSLPDLFGISLSAIEKRKVLIKKFFSISDGGDEEIVWAAKSAGFI